MEDGERGRVWRRRGPADLANHGVGGSGDAAVSTKNPEQTPNKALYPTGAVVS